MTSKKPVRPQATLFAEKPKEDRQEKKFRVVDEIRTKFGIHTVGTGLTLASPSTQNG